MRDITELNAHELPKFLMNTDCKDNFIFDVQRHFFK